MRGDMSPECSVLYILSRWMALKLISAKFNLSLVLLEQHKKPLIMQLSNYKYKKSSNKT